MTMLVAAVAVTGSVVFGAASPAAAAPTYPQPDGRCVDQTGLLGQPLCAQVTAVLLRDEASTSDEIAVAVVPTTGDASIETWSTGLFNTWGVGKKATDNGILLVVAVNDHHLRIATGRGMSSRFSDGQASEIINATITPQFAKGAYAAGILAGLDEIRRKAGHTIPAGGELVALTSKAAGPTAVASATDVPATRPPAEDAPATELPLDEVPGAGTAHGDNPMSPMGAALIDGLSVGLCMLLCLLPFGAVLTLAVISSRLAGRRSRPFARPPQSQDGYNSASASQSFWSAGDSAGSSGYSAGSSGYSAGSSGYSDSGSSGSSFGGGGSDGGGSSGSW